MKTILITGINGFLGSHLAKRLKDQYHIIGLEVSIENLFRVKDLDFEIYSSKETDLELIFRTHHVSSVIHTATIYRKQQEPIEDLIHTNILLPVRLFELSEKYHIENFFNTDSFFSSPANKKYKYLQDYTLSKCHAMEWLRLLQSNCRLINMRIYHMYGPDDSPQKFVPFILDRLMKNEDIDLTLGEQTRDFVHIDDVVSAFATVLLKSESSIMSGTYEFDVATGKSITIKEFVETAKTVMKSSSVLKWGALPYRENEIMKSESDIETLKKVGWEPKISSGEGIETLY